MKTLTAAALTEIAKQFGTEPVTIVEIVWATGGVSQYADKDIVGIDGKILEAGQIESVLRLDNVQSFTVSITLDDTDNSIKGIVDTIDIHKRPCTIYQLYGGLATSEKFIMFTGVISTPFSWGENDRQITFSVTSEIENFEVGFSPEEGQLSFVSEELKGKAWPMAFGNVVHSPAVKVFQTPKAKLIDRFCLPDPMLPFKIQEIIRAYQLESFMLGFWELVRIGANQTAPPVWWVIQEYVKIIIKEDQIVVRASRIQRSLNRNKILAQKLPHSRIIRSRIANDVRDLQVLSRISQLVQDRKKWLEDQVGLIIFAYDLAKKAMLNMIKAYNNMLRLYADYFQIVQQQCEQALCFNAVVRVQNADSFPNGTNVNVCIKKVAFRVTFNTTTNLMTFRAGPLDQFVGEPLAVWQKDDAPCQSITKLDGLNLFWLRDAPAVNMTGMFLLVRKKGSTNRHIIEVERQVGQKVYFKLIRWAKQEGQPRALDLNKIINEIVDVNEQFGNFDTPIPPSVYQGQLSALTWNRAETQLLLSIIADIPDGVNAEELRNLAQLVFRLKFDILKEFILIKPTARDVFTIIGEDIVEITAASAQISFQWLLNYRIPFEEVPKEAFFEAPPGTDILPCGNTCEIYIANILPSTIKGVFAYRQNIEGERFLAPVPSSYYIKNEAKVLGTLTVTVLTFKAGLKTIPGEKWEDIVYVTMASSVGPNSADIIKHLVETYTDKPVDSGSFASVNTAVADYPANFTLFTRPDALTEIQRIAWESRCAVFIRDGKVFIKYLGTKSSIDATITEAEIETASLKVIFTQTENLMTRIIGIYATTYLPLEPGEEEKKIVLRHNVKKYGLHSRTEKFHIYNLPELVEKSATFWLIRQSNTWKMVSLKSFHSKINVDTLDLVTLDLVAAHVVAAGAPVDCIVEKATYNPEDNSMIFELNTGIRTGEMTQYPFFWAGSVSPSNSSWPQQAEIDKGFAGGHGPGSGVIGTIDTCPS